MRTFFFKSFGNFFEIIFGNTGVGIKENENFTGSFFGTKISLKRDVADSS